MKYLLVNFPSTKSSFIKSRLKVQLAPWIWLLPFLYWPAQVIFAVRKGQKRAAVSSFTAPLICALPAQSERNRPCKVHCEPVTRTASQKGRNISINIR